MSQNKKKEKRAKLFSNKRGIKWLFRLMSGIGISVVCYFVFSLFLDTPLEYEIKKSNRILEEQYSTLKQRYDSINSVLNNIIERDREIHKILFEAEPYTSWQDSTGMNADKEKGLMNKTNMELGDELITRTGLLYQRVHNLNARMNSSQRYVLDNRNYINKIPAIQPIDNPDFSLLTASFGERIQPFYKSMKMHNGVDFSIPVGTAVFATADGTVMEINTRGQATGLSMKVRHDNNYETYYANLGRTIAHVGQRINRGDVIAFSGNSGMSFAPHLHYEVIFKGKPVDPINYFFLEVDIHNQDRLKRIAATGMQSFD